MPRPIPEGCCEKQSKMKYVKALCKLTYRKNVRHIIMHPVKNNF